MDDMNEDTNIPTDPDTDDVVVEKKTREITEYEKELRSENAKFRKQMKLMKDEFAAEIQKTKTETENYYRDRVAFSELKAQAIRANIVDTDVLKLLDRSKAVFNEDGEITNAAELIEGFRANKPHLFSSATSVAQNVPKPKEPISNGKLDWSSMSDAEKKAKMREIGIR